MRNALKMLPSQDALDSEDANMLKAFVGNPLGKKTAFMQVSYIMFVGNPLGKNTAS